MSFTSGQYGPEPLIDSAGNALIGASVTVPVGYTAVVDSRGNLTITGPVSDAVTFTVVYGGLSLSSLTVAVLAKQAELLDAATAASSFLPFTGAAPSDGVLQYQIGRSTAVAGSKMRIDWLREKSTYKMEDEAGIWANPVYAFAGVSKEFTSATGAAPSVGLFAFTNNNGSTSDVVAVLGDSVARTATGSVFGGNLIVRNGAGVNGARLVGLEIDLQPSAGTTIAAGSIGLAINTYNIATGAPAIQLGSLGGGTFANGLIINSVTGAGVAAQSGSSAMASLIDASPGTYTSDAVILGNGQKLRLMGTAGTHAKIYNDGSNNVRLVLGTGVLAVRDSGDATSLFTFDNTGGLTLSTLKVGASQVVTSRRTGWTSPTGTATRTGYVTSTATATQVAEALKALIDDLTAHGLIGA
jgi:hypothetical protein